MDVLDNLTNEPWKLRAGKNILELQISTSCMFVILCRSDPQIKKEYMELEKGMRETEPYKTLLADADDLIARLEQVEQEVRYDENNQ